MITVIFDWLDEASGRVPIFVLPVRMEETAFDWSTAISTAIGGLATLAAALIAFWLGNRAEQRRRYEKQKNEDAANALSGFLKLSQWTDLLINIEMFIDRSFKDAQENGLTAFDPYAMVNPAAGKFVEPEFLVSSEYSFLLTSEDYELVSHVGLVERRAASLNRVLEKYSSIHQEMQNWLESLPEIEREIDGPIASDKIPLRYKSHFDRRVAQLNLLVAGMIEHLHGDITLAKETTQRFGDVASNKFAPFFPKLKFEERGARG